VKDVIPIGLSMFAVVDVQQAFDAGLRLIALESRL
jgi:hypothetical protein